MNDDELIALLKEESPYISDNGFSLQVIDSLPPSRTFRFRFIGTSILISCAIAFAVWIFASQHHRSDLFASPWITSSVALAAWLFLAAFAYLTFQEDVFEI